MITLAIPLTCCAVGWSILSLWAKGMSTNPYERVINRPLVVIWCTTLASWAWVVLA